MDKRLDIGTVLYSFMEERRIGGAELSRASGVSESEVYNVLKNRRGRAGLKTLEKLLHPLGKTLADLFNRLSESDARNLRKLEKEPAFVMEFKKQGLTIFSDIPPWPELFIGRISLLAGSKGYTSEGLKERCTIFLRVLRGQVEVEYGGKSYPLSTYQKLLLNGRYRYRIRNRSATEAAEALLVTTPSLLNSASP